jgi:hypothetical protein
VNDDVREMLIRTRAEQPEAITIAAQRRPRRPVLGTTRRLMIIAADHTARGILSVGGRSGIMADRIELLDRLTIGLSRPGVDGVLGTADIIEDLLLLGALDGKLVIGSMNRGGLPGSAFEIDDRFTGYRACDIAAGALDGGKMLLRIDLSDPATAPTLESAAAALRDLSAARLMAVVEPFLVTRKDGRAVNDLTPDAVIKSVTIAAGLGGTSAYTWLKLPVVPEMERVAAASTLPVLLLGGDSAGDPDLMYASWQQALRLPTVRGLVVGRSLLYPPDDDVAGAVDTAVGLL